jgi:general stress protein 26
MESINKNQTENNHKDLNDQDAIEKIKELTKDNKVCYFCTHSSGNNSLGTRPMAVQEIDDEGNLWFLSSKDSHKNLELEKDNSVRLLFQGSKHSDFMVIEGNASISDDKEKIKELWEPIVKTWFTEGVDDPRISVIKVEPVKGYYWDNKHGNAVAGIKMLIGAAIGKTMDDSVEGRITV